MPHLIGLIAGLNSLFGVRCALIELIDHEEKIGRYVSLDCCYLILHLSLFAAQSEKQSIVIDGDLSDPFWQSIAPGKLVPVEAGASSEMGGEVRAKIARSLSLP